ncbi:carboxylating nicotinate-nucleotide diphosphorylase [candidate division KSB1 bacterium]|nr:carboxylating nicotinate-nucleotide diphosphorylase [candidate division KSB1 bacterium]
MKPALKLTNEIESLIDLALREDLGENGDVTSNCILNSDDEGQASIIVKKDGIIAGLPIAEWVFKKVNPGLKVQNRVEEGSKVQRYEEVVRIIGPLAGILTAERTGLNFLQRLSGIATLTAEFVRKVAGTKVRILDTRKTTPGFRVLEKYAVRAGGGGNHRFGLYDMVLIKENHIAAAGGIASAVEQTRENMKKRDLNLKIEVEVRNLSEVEQVLNLAVDRLMLDNMSLQKIREAVKLANGKVELEVSGGVTLETVREIAETGVNYISVGALTHSASSLDLSLLIDAA